MSRPFARLLPGVAMLAIIAGGATAASAAPILIQSGNPGAGQSETCNSSTDSSLTTCVDVTPHPAWQPNDPNFPSGSGGTNPSSAVWVSFTDTGAGSNSTFQPAGTILTYTYTFMAPPNAQFMGRLWSDNEATVYLDGMMVGGGNATVGGGSSFGAGGGYAISGTLGGGGGGGGGGGCAGCTTHTISATVVNDAGAQTSADNPGPAVLLDGTVNPSEVPEPATLALFGMGLVGAGAIRRKRKQA